MIYILGLIAHALAVAADATSRGLDRAGWALDGHVDPVDRHYAQTIRDDRRRPGADPIAAAQRFVVAASVGPNATGVNGTRRVLAVEHRPVAGVAAVPTLAHVEVLGQDDAARAIGAVVRRFYNGMGRSDGDDLAAMLERDGVLLARRIR